jgi:parvulin-like peptidyl-prolyl isomerase
MNLNISYAELNNMSVDELKQLLNSLGVYIDTPDESKAKLLAQQIRELICTKDNYGF